MAAAAGDPVARLSQLLGGLAMYNDKGYQWARHSLQQQTQERRNAQVEIDQLVVVIGEDRFPAGLLQELEDGTAAEDGSGRIAAEFNRRFC